MRLHEYEAKEIFHSYGISKPVGDAVRTPEEAVKKAEEIGFPVVIKAQVLVGGRGLAGGIKFAESVEEVRNKTDGMLNADIRTYRADEILVEKKLDIETEFYAGITIDGTSGCPIVMVSSEGGVAVEETATQHPERMCSLHTDVFLGLHSYQARKLAKALGLQGKEMFAVAAVLSKLYKVFEDYDALIAEINPLVVTKNGSLFAADAVLEIDDSALYKYPTLKEKSLDRISDELEREAKKIGVSYVSLDGDIGVICSGAGLGMASIDMIKSQGEPANFLETGGGITKELMADALYLVLKKPGIRAVFINLYGGINPIHEGAKGIAEVIQEEGVTIPIVAKAYGNFQEETWVTLESAGVKVVKQTQTGRAVQELFKTLSRN